MKRILCFILAGFMLLTLLAGCDQGAGNTGSADSVIISEVMPDNKKLCLSHENDWVELHNPGQNAVSLDNCYLTDDPNNLHAMPLKGLTIPAGGYLVVTLDDNSPFRLSADGETVCLVGGSEILSELTFGLTENGESLDSNGICEYPTPGFANTYEGYLAYLDGLSLPELIISEVMSSNSKHYPVGGECYDMVEIRNNSDQPIDLGSYALTDKRSEMTRYQFPDVTLQPGEYFTVYCSGDTSLGNNHTSFKLSAAGETVYLSKNGSYIDALVIPGTLPKNQSYGRIGNVPTVLPRPTFGTENVAE